MPNPRFGFADFHAAYEALMDEKDVLDHFVHQQLSGLIVNHGADIDHNASSAFGEAHWLDLWIQHFPLARPIVSYPLVAMYVPSLPSVRPIHLGMQGGEDFVDIAGVEGSVGFG